MFILNSCWLESSPFFCVSLTFFHLDNAPNILETIRSKKQPFSHNWPKEFLKNKSLYSHCWAVDFLAKWNSGWSRLFSPNSTHLWGIPINFSASTQAMSWCSCTVLYQPNMCPHCPADLYTLEGRTALHSCFVQSVGWFVCLLFHYEKRWPASFL